MPSPGPTWLTFTPEFVPFWVLGGGAGGRGRRNNDSPEIPSPNPRNLWMFPYWREDLADVIKLRISRWRDGLGLFRWVQYNLQGPYKGKKEAQREKMTFCCLWRRKKGSWTREWRQLLGAETQEVDTPLEMQPCWHVDFSQIRPVMDVWPLEPWENECVLF